MSSDLTVQELLERNKYILSPNPTFPSFFHQLILSQRQYSANPTPLPLLTQISSTGLKKPRIVICP